jgi:hypothetical protein
MELVGIGQHTSECTNSKNVQACVAKPFGNGVLCYLPTNQCSHNEKFEMLDGRPKTIFLFIIFCNACWFKCPIWWCHLMVSFVRFLFITNKLDYLWIKSTSSEYKSLIWLNVKEVFFLLLTLFLRYNNHGRIQYYCIE